MGRSDETRSGAEEHSNPPTGWKVSQVHDGWFMQLSIQLSKSCPANVEKHAAFPVIEGWQTLTWFHFFFGSTWLCCSVHRTLHYSLNNVPV